MEHDASQSIYESRLRHFHQVVNELQAVSVLPPQSEGTDDNGTTPPNEPDDSDGSEYLHTSVSSLVALDSTSFLYCLICSEVVQRKFATLDPSDPSETFQDVYSYHEWILTDEKAQILWFCCSCRSVLQPDWFTRGEHRRCDQCVGTRGKNPERVYISSKKLSISAVDGTRLKGVGCVV